MSTILRYLLDVSREDLPDSWTDAGVMVKLSEAIGGAGFDVRLLTPRDAASDPVEVEAPGLHGAAVTVAAFLARELGREDLASRAFATIGVKS